MLREEPCSAISTSFVCEGAISLGYKSVLFRRDRRSQAAQALFLNKASFPPPLSPSPPYPFLALLNIEPRRKCKQNFGLD